jgi:hypothetical protein
MEWFMKQAPVWVGVLVGFGSACDEASSGRLRRCFDELTEPTLSSLPRCPQTLRLPKLCDGWYLEVCT